MFDLIPNSSWFYCLERTYWEIIEFNPWIVQKIERQRQREWCQELCHKVNSLKNEIDRYLRFVLVFSIFLLVRFGLSCESDFLLCVILLFLPKPQQAQKHPSEWDTHIKSRIFPPLILSPFSLKFTFHRIAAISNRFSHLLLPHDCQFSCPKKGKKRAKNDLLIFLLVFLISYKYFLILILSLIDRIHKSVA